jgi:hypothetical protein
MTTFNFAASALGARSFSPAVLRTTISMSFTNAVQPHPSSQNAAPHSAVDVSRMRSELSPNSIEQWKLTLLCFRQIPSQTIWLHRLSHLGAVLKARSAGPTAEERDLHSTATLSYHEALAIGRLYHRLYAESVTDGQVEEIVRNLSSGTVLEVGFGVTCTLTRHYCSPRFSLHHRTVK